MFFRLLCGDFLVSAVTAASAAKAGSARRGKRREMQCRKSAARILPRVPCASPFRLICARPGVPVQATPCRRAKPTRSTGPPRAERRNCYPSARTSRACPPPAGAAQHISSRLREPPVPRCCVYRAQAAKPPASQRRRGLIAADSDHARCAPGKLPQGSGAVGGARPWETPWCEMSCLPSRQESELNNEDAGEEAASQGSRRVWGRHLKTICK